MNAEELKALQAPIKERCREDPGAALITLRDMLLEALVACAGVTLDAVATALGILLKDARVTAEGDLDFRGTLGVAKDCVVMQTIRNAVPVRVL
jgi:hypothetical protein